MAAHWGLDFFESHARSGHSICTNRERQLEQNIIPLTLPGAYALNRWVNETPKKSYPAFHCLDHHVTEHAHFLINELCIVSVLNFKQYESLYLVLLAETDGMVIYHSSVGTILDTRNTYTPRCARVTKNPKSSI